MRIGHLLLHDEPHDVVHVRHDQPAVEEQPDGRPPVARKCHVTREREPHERRSEDGDDRCETGQHAPEQRARGVEDQVAHKRHDALYDGQQGDADGVRADDHVHLAHDAAAHVAVERQYLAAVLLHAQAADEHEIEHEQQHDDVDAEIHDAAQHPLPQMRDHPHERRDIPLLPKVVSRLFVDQRCDVFERLDDRLGLEGDVLHLVDDHPDDQTDRHQETEHRLAQQQRRGQAAPPFAAGREVMHLPPEQHVDRHGTQHPAQKRGQLDEDRDPQSEDQHEKRITPV